MTRLTRLAINEPSVTVLVMLLLLVAGVAAAVTLNQELIPDIDFPQASVVAVWPGASADQVTQEVVKPIEKALEQLGDIEVVEVSSSASDSFAAVTVRAEFGTTQDQLRQALDDSLADVDLPEDVQELETVLFNFSDLPVVQIGASGDLSLEELQRLIQDEVVPELEAIDGVSRVSVAGGRAEKVFVDLDPEKMAAAGVTLDTIKNVLQANNLSFPAGTLNTDGQSIPLQVGHRIKSVEDLRQLVLVPPAPPIAAGAAPSTDAAEQAPPAPAQAEAPGPEQAAATKDVAEAPTPTPTESEHAATSPSEAPTVSGPFPLPPLLQALGFETTDDLTPDLIRELEAGAPDLLRQLADDVIETLPPGALAELSPGVVDALPPDLRQRLIERASGPATPPAAVAPTPPAETVRMRAVIVSANDTLDSLANRFGTDPEAIRQANGLTSDTLTPGDLLRVPLPAGGATLPPAWRAFGVTRADEVTPAVMERAIAETPGAVSDLTPEQLLLLPPTTIARLPEALIARQGPEIEAALVARSRLPAEAPATPEQEAPPTATPPPTPTVRPTEQPASTAASPTAGAPAAAQGPGQETSPVTLGDIATVARAPEDLSAINRIDGHPSLSLLIVKDQSANTVTVADAVLDRVDELKDERLLQDVTFDTIFEQASFIKESLSGVVREGVLGAVFAVLAILVFLSLSVRSTVVTAISIPLSVFIGFLIMRVQGFTLNLLTLSGMTVAIGRVVDDAIVVLENVYRHIQRGERRVEAVIEGTEEVATAITASTLVTVAVFLPLGFMGGIISQFFLPFGLTVSFALLASLLVALTIVPVLARLLLSRGVLPEERETWLQRAYTPVLEWALDHRLITLLLAFAFFIASLGLARFIPQTFLPNFGEPTISVSLSLPGGASLETTDEAAREVEAILADDADIDTVRATVGSSGGPEALFFGLVGGDSSGASFFATLDQDFDGDPVEVADRIRQRLEDLDVGLPVSTTVSTGALGGPQGSIYDLQILSEDEATLREANALVLNALRDEDNWSDYDVAPIINLESNLSAARDIIAVEVDPASALSRGLTAAQVGFALRQVLEGQDLGDVELAGESEEQVLTVEARFPAETISTIEGLHEFAIAGPAGPVRLGDIATIEHRPGPVVITRVDGEPAALITGEITEEDTLGVMADADAIIDDLDLPADVEVGAGVESSTQLEGFQDMLVALPISIAIVYLIMAVVFGSLVHPFTILFSLPFAASGALVGLAVTGRPLSISSLIGVLMLIGIVVTNAIVLVDLVQRYRARGMTAREALVRGGRTRLRPILMTAVATVLALFPMALGFTEGAIIAAELATVVIFGLTTSTLLTLIVVPVMYSLLDGLTRRRRALQPAVTNPTATAGP